MDAKRQGVLIQPAGIAVKRAIQMKKKKIIVAVYIGIICVLFHAMQAKAAEVIFDADAVVEKTATKSSLMDVNGVFVFRDEFIEQERAVRQEEKDRLEQIEQLVLASSQQDFDCEAWVNLVLQADTEKFIKEIYQEKKESSLRWWIYCGTASVCILCIAARMEEERRKRKLEKAGEVEEHEQYRDI